MVQPILTARFPNAVRVGGMDKQELLQALHEHRIQVNQAAQDLFDDPRFIPLSKSTTIEIAARTVSDLGFPQGASYEELTARALESGFDECPLDLGPQLRLQYRDQPEAPANPAAPGHRAPPGSITVASAPLDKSDKSPKGFYLRRSEGVLWLRGYWSSPGHVWSPEDVLVFSRVRARISAVDAPHKT